MGRKPVRNIYCKGKRPWMHGPETGVELLNRMNHAIQTEDSQAVNEMICSYERINEMTEQLFELK